jgi:hypothetical protein
MADSGVFSGDEVAGLVQRLVPMMVCSSDNGLFCCRCLIAVDAVGDSVAGFDTIILPKLTLMLSRQHVLLPVYVLVRTFTLMQISVLDADVDSGTGADTCAHSMFYASSRDLELLLSLMLILSFSLLLGTLLLERA